MSHNWNHVLEDNDDKEEYVELKEPQHIQAILRAEQEQKNRAHQESILKIIDEKPTEPSPAPKPVDQKPKFIEDDRERTYPNQRPKIDNNEKRSATNHEANEVKAKNEQVIDKREQKKQKKQYKPRQQLKQKQNETKQETFHKDAEIRDKKARSSQKQKAKYRERAHSSKKNKQVQKQVQIKHRKQIEIIKGEQITLEFDQQQFQNQIYVGKKDASIYFQRAKDYIKIYEFIVLKSWAIYISKAVLIAGLMAKEYPQLKQVNIPSTIELQATTNEKSRVQTRGAIRIELSLHNLEKNHIGYQESSKANPHAQKQTKKEAPKYKEKETKYIEKQAPKYAQKQAPKYVEKKSTYAEKEPYKSYRKQRRGESSEKDERHLR